ncbi:uncharacterized protein LOC113850764 [Abrus precatorius]|uniref:Uncharacterized protein LOC113850764 n=1 Tax=Abrus precatorius TaxID=3816 RepID=A0A8B8K265_ABRPR|nr:uncharacterized protein LOC113850764 [Abrus precatorius]
MANNQHERTHKYLAAPDVTYQPLGIQYPDVDAPFELKSGLIHLLSKFNRSAGLALIERSMLDAASGRALMDKTPSTIRALIDNMIENSQQFNTRAMALMRKNVNASIQDLQTQIGQLATIVNQFKSQSSEQLPSQIEVNPRNVSAIILRSGKELLGNQKDDEVQDDVDVEKQQNTEQQTAPSSSEIVQKPPLPFSNRVAKPRPPTDFDKELFETFRRVEVNIPLLDEIKQIPKYAKFLKKLCTKKERLKGDERVNMGRNVSTLIQPNMPQKCKDPGTFTVPCTIGNSTCSNALLDLGASINLMHTLIYRSLSLNPLKQTGVVIQLANRSIAFSARVVEDILVRVDKLIFPADFYILEMAEESNMPTLILGRPFLETTRTKIDVYSGILFMEFGDDIVQFNIFEAMKHPSELHSAFHIDIIDVLIEEFCTDFSDISSCTCTIGDLCKICAEIDTYLIIDDVSCDAAGGLENSGLMHAVELDFSTKTLLSIMQPPALELKPLPKHLKYAFLEADNKLSVIISAYLDAA